MVEPSEDPALGLESPEDRRRVHPPLDELERDGLLEEAVGAGGTVDGPHPAVSGHALDPVGPEPGARREVVQRVAREDAEVDRRVEERGWRRAEHREHLGLEVGVARGPLADEVGAGLWRRAEGGEVEVLEAVPARGHRCMGYPDTSGLGTCEITSCRRGRGRARLSPFASRVAPWGRRRRGPRPPPPV